MPFALPAGGEPGYVAVDYAQGLLQERVTNASSGHRPDGSWGATDWRTADLAEVVAVRHNEREGFSRA